jgi:hypothetical protein
MTMALLPESTRAKLIVAQLAVAIRGKSAPNPSLAPSLHYAAQVGGCGANH